MMSFTTNAASLHNALPYRAPSLPRPSSASSPSGSLGGLRRRQRPSQRRNVPVVTALMKRLMDERVDYLGCRDRRPAVRPGARRRNVHVSIEARWRRHASPPVAANEAVALDASGATGGSDGTGGMTGRSVIHSPR